MIKIILEINEAKTKTYGNVDAIRCDVDVEEIGIKATRSEIETSKLLKERIGVSQKVQLVNHSSDRGIASKILNDLGL